MPFGRSKWRRGVGERSSRRKERRFKIASWGGLFFLGLGLILAKWVMTINVKSVKPFTRSQAEAAVSPASWVKFPLELKEPVDSHFEGGAPHGQRVVYTLKPDLQRTLEKVLQRYRVPYGAVVALEPSTGKILAMAAHSAVGHPDIRNFCQRATFPAASIFKLITASAALDLGLLTPDSQISYQGNMYLLSPAKLDRTRGALTPLEEALARSNNVVFGKVGQIVGTDNLRKYARAFGFNRTLVKELPLEPSRAYIPSEAYELARCGAGFGEVTLSPLHGAMIAAAIANEGEMMLPTLIEEVRDANGERVYQAQPASLGRVIGRETARELGQMMQKTIRAGTSRRAFHVGGRPCFPNMAISGKTGSLSGTDPVGHYSWFVGFAPSEAPQVAVAALVINPGGGAARIKGSELARFALQAFFRGRIEEHEEELQFAQRGTAPEISEGIADQQITPVKGKKARRRALTRAGFKLGDHRVKRVRRLSRARAFKIRKAVATTRLRIRKASFSSNSHLAKGKASSKGKANKKRGAKRHKRR